MGKRLNEKNPFLRDPEKKRKLMVSAIVSAQRQEGIELSESKAEEVYKIVFEEPPIAFYRLTRADINREEQFTTSLTNGALRFDVPRRNLLAVDSTPLAYWVSAEVLQLFRSMPALATFGDARQGLATANDSRFLREWWEVSRATVEREMAWVPFAKGGDFCRFYADIDLRVWWRNNGYDIRHFGGTSGPASRAGRGESFYFLPGLTWPRRTQRGLNVRSLPRGCIFADKGPSIFPRHPVDANYLLGALNSSLSEYLCRVLMSFGSYEVGVIQQIPVPALGSGSKEHVSVFARRIHDAKANWDEGNEISTIFREPWLASALREHGDRPLTEAQDAVATREVAADTEIQVCYAELDTAVFDAYGLSPETRETVLKDLGDRPAELIWPQMEGKSAEQKRMEHVFRLLSSCVKQVIEGDDDGITPLAACNNEPPLAERVLAELGKLVGSDRAHLLEGEIASELRKKVPGYKRSDSITDFLADVYFEHHVRLYRTRPIFWHLASTPDGGGTPAFSVLVHYHRFGRDSLRKLRGTYIRSFLDRRARELARARQDNRTDEAIEIQQGIEETQSFDKKLQQLEEGRPAIRVPWKKAGEQPKGWDPDIDDGVKVNILPLQTAGLLRIAKVVSTKGDEDAE